MAEKTTLDPKGQVDARWKSSSVAHHSSLETDSMQGDRSEILAFYYQCQARVAKIRVFCYRISSVVR